MHHLTPPSARGHTLTDVAGLLVVVALVLGVTPPVAKHNREVNHTAGCADRLRTLLVAAAQRANDHDGRYFRHWQHPKDFPQLDDGLGQSAWWDRDQIGAYLPDARVVRNGLPGLFDSWEDRPAFGVTAEALICPAMQDDEFRSYDMNFWASGIKVPAGRKGPDLRAGPPPWLEKYPGTFFDSHTADDPSRLMMFGEALAHLPTILTPESTGWATCWDFGKRFLPGQRFSAAPQLNVNGDLDFGFRWQRLKKLTPTTFDFGRHGGERRTIPETGSANFGQADGHVRFRQATELYDDKTRNSTYEILWSPVDREIETLLKKANP